MIASHPEVSVIPSKTEMKFALILLGSLYFLLYCSHSIAKGWSLGNFILLLYPIGAPWYLYSILHCTVAVYQWDLKVNKLRKLIFDDHHRLLPKSHITISHSQEIQPVILANLIIILECSLFWYGFNYEITSKSKNIIPTPKCYLFLRSNGNGSS